MPARKRAGRAGRGGPRRRSARRPDFARETRLVSGRAAPRFQAPVPQARHPRGSALPVRLARQRLRPHGPDRRPARRDGDDPAGGGRTRGARGRRDARGIPATGHRRRPLVRGRSQGPRKRHLARLPLRGRRARGPGVRGGGILPRRTLSLLYRRKDDHAQVPPRVPHNYRRLSCRARHRSARGRADTTLRVHACRRNSPRFRHRARRGTRDLARDDRRGREARSRHADAEGPRAGREQLARVPGRHDGAAHGPEEGRAGAVARSRLAVESRPAGTHRGPGARPVRARRRRSRAAPETRRRHRLRARHRALAVGRVEGAHVRAPDADLPRPPAPLRPADQVRHHAHPRARARTGPPGRRGNCGGKISRSASRHPVGRQGPPRHEGHPHDLGGGAVSKPRPGHGRDRCETPPRCRRRPRREAEPRRVRAQRRLVRGRDEEPLGARGRLRGQQRGTRVGNGSRPRRLFDRERDGREHRRPLDALRRHGSQAYVRARRAHGRDDALLVDGQAGPDDARRRRHAARPRGDLGPRRGRRLERAEPARLRGGTGRCPASRSGSSPPG